MEGRLRTRSYRRSTSGCWQSQSTRNIHPVSAGSRGLHQGIHRYRRELRARLQEIAWLVPRLRLSFQRRELRAPWGLVHAIGRQARVLPGTLLRLVGHESDLRVELALALTRSRDTKPQFRSFVNHRGFEHEPLKAAVKYAIGQAFQNAGPLLRRIVCASHVSSLGPKSVAPTARCARLPRAFPELVATITRELSAETDTRIAWLEALRTG